MGPLARLGYGALILLDPLGPGSWVHACPWGFPSPWSIVWTLDPLVCWTICWTQGTCVPAGALLVEVVGGGGGLILPMGTRICGKGLGLWCLLRERQFS